MLLNEFTIRREIITADADRTESVVRMARKGEIIATDTIRTDQIAIWIKEPAGSVEI